ncbi:MAG: hypothetical protein HW399_257 [Dehalococcoidia bacterium]|nr:hypothetical protein [Dehalococcoidia bacterium]
MSNRWLIIIGSIVAILIVVSVIVAISTQNNLPILSEDTPEGTVQRYLQALERDDLTLAYSYLSVSAKERKTFQEFSRELGFGSKEVQQRQVTLEKSRVFGNTAEVQVTISEFRPSGPLTFQPSENSFQSNFSLQKQDGKWFISDASWPVYFPVPIKPPPPPQSVP